MLARGFRINFTPDLQKETEAIKSNFTDLSIRDLTGLLWSSIDNDDSKDLDQIEYSESVSNGVRIYIGIADVSSLVSKDSRIDDYAKNNTTSVYTGVEVFPMLPTRLSTDLTSLNEGQKNDLPW